MVEQLEDDWPKAGTKKKKPSKATNGTGDILKEGQARITGSSEVQQQSKEKKGHSMSGMATSTLENCH